MDDYIKTCFDEGFEAFLQGHKRASCEYPSSSNEYWYWMRGWDDAALTDMTKDNDD